MSWTVAWVIIVASIVVNSFFAGVETGFTSARRVRLLHQARKGFLGAALAARLLRRREDLVVGAVVGNNVAIVSGTAVATAAFVGHMGEAGETVAAVVMSTLNIIFGEILPKTLYRAHPELLVRWSSHVFLVLITILRPLQWLAVGLATGILWLLGEARSHPVERFTKAELLRVFALSREHEQLDEDQNRLLEQFVRNSRISLSRLMTPMDRVACISAQARVADVIERVRSTGHSRLPVTDVDGDVRGLILFRDLIHCAPGEGLAAREREVVRVPAHMALDEAIGVLTDQQVSLAIVVDADQRAREIVTLEDLLEPLLGDIIDEHDLVGMQKSRTAQRAPSAGA